MLQTKISESNPHKLQCCDQSYATNVVILNYAILLDDTRQKRSPVNLEEQLSLKVNKRFCDAKVIQELFAI